jgi:pyrroline-5-carboxylate reductase
MKIGLIGGGAMGEAIVSAVTPGENAIARGDDITVFDIASDRLRYLSQTYGVRIAETAPAACDSVDFLLLATKPQQFDEAARMIKGGLGGATAVSIMAGVPMSQIATALRTDAVVRAMPNTPAQVGQGMTGWTASPTVSEEAREGVRKIFAAMGKEAFLPDEKYLDMVTGLSGSGPAYVFLFIEALTDAGVHIGLPRDIASVMASQTVLGSAVYAEKTGKHPAELRNQVTSPGGTTAEGLRALELGNFRADVLEAVIAAYEKSKALGEATKGVDGEK